MVLLHQVQKHVERRIPARASVEITIMFKGRLSGLYARELLAKQRKLFPVNCATTPICQSGPRNDDGAAADADEGNATHAAFP